MKENIFKVIEKVGLDKNIITTLIQRFSETGLIRHAKRKIGINPATERIKASNTSISETTFHTEIFQVGKASRQILQYSLPESWKRICLGEFHSLSPTFSFA